MNIQTEFELNRSEQLEIGLVESANAFKWLMELCTYIERSPIYRKRGSAADCAESA